MLKTNTYEKTKTEKRNHRLFGQYPKGRRRRHKYYNTDLGNPR